MIIILPFPLLPAGAFGALNGLNGYGQVIYQGDTYLITKYYKKIKNNSVENTYDSFNEAQVTWLVNR